MLPHCFVAQANLSGDTAKAVSVLRADNPTTVPTWEDAVFRVINAPRRDCTWYKWNPSLTPHQHYEEWRMLQLERDRKEWQERLSQIEQRSQARESKIGRWLAVAALILALAQVLTVTDEPMALEWARGVIESLAQGDQ